MNRRLYSIYQQLLGEHGPQHWWPGDSRFEIMVGAVLTQSTAWTNVERAIAHLRRARALSPKAILSTSPRRLAGWLRPSGYFNVKARRLRALCRWLAASGGVRALNRLATGELRSQLLAVHGIGPETADDMLLYAFERPVFVIDAYTRRLFGRLGLIDANVPYEKLRAWFESGLSADTRVYNEYHALIVAHAKRVCRPKPQCPACVLRRRCAAARLQPARNGVS